MMFDWFGAVREYRRLLKEANDHIKVLQEALKQANETTSQSVENFKNIYACYQESQATIEQLKRGC